MNKFAIYTIILTMVLSLAPLSAEALDITNYNSTLNDVYLGDESQNPDSLVGSFDITGISINRQAVLITPKHALMPKSSYNENTQILSFRNEDGVRFSRNIAFTYDVGFSLTQTCIRVFGQCQETNFVLLVLEEPLGAETGISPFPILVDGNGGSSSILVQSNIVVDLMTFDYSADPDLYVFGREATGKPLVAKNKLFGVGGSDISTGELYYQNDLELGTPFVVSSALDAPDDELYGQLESQLDSSSPVFVAVNGALAFVGFNVDYTDLTLYGPGIGGGGVLTTNVHTLVAKRGLIEGLYYNITRSCRIAGAECYEPTLFPPIDPTIADLNGDGLYSLDDVVLFITAFQAQDEIADLDNNTAFDSRDINMFIEAFQIGSNPAE